jgi:hypothetical protein
MSATGLAAVVVRDQFYVTHCTTADSVLNSPGYSVRAASTDNPRLLRRALDYPPYELPLAMWGERPPASHAPRRLARTGDPAGGIWVVHTVYLEKDTMNRDRSYFSHLLYLNAADAATVLRLWGADGWATHYPQDRPKTLAGNPRLPVGSLVSDANLTAFLGDSPPGPTELSVAVCPERFRRSATQRRDVFARVLQAVLVTAAEVDDRHRKLFIYAEPGVVALLLYGAVRLLPPAVAENLTFSTYEPPHRSLRDYDLAEVVGTYMGASGAELPPDLGTRGFVLDTFDLARSSATLGGRVPARVLALIDLAASGRWDQLPATSPSAADASARGNDRVAHAAALLRDQDPPASVAPPPSGARAPNARFGSAPSTSERVPPPKPVAPAPVSERPTAMTYSAQITRTNPACVLLLIDQSGSMKEQFAGGTGQTKAVVVADAVNRLLQNLVLRSAKADGIRDYFRVGVVGYGKAIKAGLGGSVPFEVLAPISCLGAYPLRVESRTKLVPDGAGGLVEQPVKFPVWFDPQAEGKTPMCEALAAACLAVKGFVEEFPDAYPPIVLNLTDGIPSDGSPQENARQIRSLTTSDGAVLLFNLLISSKQVPAEYFPSSEDMFTDNFSKLLFRMSSELPPKLREAARAEGHDLKPNARGLVLNADPTAIVRFLDIGTRLTPSGR